MFANDLKIGANEAVHLANIASEFRATMTAEDFMAIYLSAGMDGEKYRKNFISAINKALKAKMATIWSTAAAAKKTVMIMIVAIMIGMMLGTTGAKRTLVKNMGAHMEERANKTDPMAIAWSIIDTHFCTYVNGPKSSTNLVPSVKYASCMGDFCLLGIIILYAQVTDIGDYRADFLAVDGSAKAYADWPDIFKKQFIGNLDVDSTFQEEHKAWERKLWDEDIGDTKNESNKEFKKGFEETFYARSVSDDLRMWTHNFYRVNPIGSKYTKAEVVDYILYYTSMFMHTKAEAVAPEATLWVDFDSNIGAAVSTGSTVNMDNVFSQPRPFRTPRVGNVGMLEVIAETVV